MPIHTQDSESASLPARPTAFSLIIQQTDASANVPPIHSCSQISQFTNAFTNAKIPTDLPTTKPKPACPNALLTGNSGASVSSTHVYSFAQTDILRTCYQTASATNNAHLHDSQTNGLQHAWCTAAKPAKTTTKTYPQEQAFASKCARATVMATTPIRHANPNMQSPYILPALIHSMPIELPNCVSSNAPLAPLLTVSQDIAR